MQEEITRLRADLNAAVVEVSKWAAKAGEAQGRLEMSESAGIVDMWRAKCEALEAEKAALADEVKRGWTAQKRVPFSVGRPYVVNCVVKHGGGDVG